ncbi:putative malate dehydrogenase (oxaloacetate-decarboxylating) (NADP(+)) [Helianthus anomalus]
MDYGGNHVLRTVSDSQPAVVGIDGPMLIIYMHRFPLCTCLVMRKLFELYMLYQTCVLTFTLYGTTSVVLAGLIYALKLVGGSLADHRFLFLGAGEAGTGIAELIALEISKQGLIVKSRLNSLQHFKKPWAQEHQPVTDLLDAVKAIRPTLLIGSSGVGQTFTKEVVETMSSFNKKPIILALSNPTSKSECTDEQAYTWSEGRAIFTSGSSSEALAAQVTLEHIEKGLIYPPFTNIPKISAHIAAKVARNYHLSTS